MSEDHHDFGPDPKPSAKPKSKATKKTTKATQKSESSNGVASSQIRSLVERIERLTEEKKAIQTDIKEVYGEAKSHGFDTKALREVVKLRAMDPAERQEQLAMVDLYLAALGQASFLDPAVQDSIQGDGDD